eukprot:TRINITY_DN103022_c0_g1_i1.p1 TRINITY_DN103022_c0_g1~~TRINITY_DN103022_c0_g1_i1.p1  ORF type:complete len:472 (+),score=100.92 TRINITY_DN103022_c0_g1_i1:74-1489(+)
MVDTVSESTCQLGVEKRGRNALTGCLQRPAPDSPLGTPKRSRRNRCCSPQQLSLGASSPRPAEDATLSTPSSLSSCSTLCSPLSCSPMSPAAERPQQAATSKVPGRGAAARDLSVWDDRSVASSSVVPVVDPAGGCSHDDARRTAAAAASSAARTPVRARTAAKRRRSVRGVLAATPKRSGRGLKRWASSPALAPVRLHAVPQMAAQSPSHAVAMALALPVEAPVDEEEVPLSPTSLAPLDVESPRQLKAMLLEMPSDICRLHYRCDEEDGGTESMSSDEEDGSPCLSDLEEMIEKLPPAPLHAALEETLPPDGSEAARLLQQLRGAAPSLDPGDYLKNGCWDLDALREDVAEDLADSAALELEEKGQEAEAPQQADGALVLDPLDADDGLRTPTCSADSDSDCDAERGTARVLALSRALSVRVAPSTPTEKALPPVLLQRNSTPAKDGSLDAPLHRKSALARPTSSLFGA